MHNRNGKELGLTLKIRSTPRYLLTVFDVITLFLQEISDLECFISICLVTWLSQATHIAWSPAAVTAIFSTAGCVKKTLTPPTDKTERGRPIGHIQLVRSCDHSRIMPLNHVGHCVRALRCRQGNVWLQIK